MGLSGWVEPRPLTPAVPPNARLVTSGERRLPFTGAAGVHQRLALDGAARTISREAGRPGVEVDPRPLVLHGVCAVCARRSTEERTAGAVSQGRCAPDPELVLVLAGHTGTVQHDVMVLGAELQAARETLDRPLQITIVKRHNTPARVTEQVMMMLAPGIDQLIARHSIPELQASDKTMLAEQLEDPLDARPRDPLVALTQPVVDLQSTKLSAQAARPAARSTPRAPAPCHSPPDQAPRARNPPTHSGCASTSTVIAAARRMRVRLVLVTCAPTGLPRRRGAPAGLLRNPDRSVCRRSRERCSRAGGVSRVRA